MIGRHNHFCQWYFLTIDKDLTKLKIQEEEIDELKWIKKEALFNEVKNNHNKFVQSMKGLLELLYKEKI